MKKSIAVFIAASLIAGSSVFATNLKKAHEEEQGWRIAWYLTQVLACVIINNVSVECQVTNSGPTCTIVISGSVKSLYDTSVCIALIKKP